jgi:hypothetical protein
MTKRVEDAGRSGSVRRQRCEPLNHQRWSERQIGTWVLSGSTDANETVT